MRYTVSVAVNVELCIVPSSSWGPECTVEMVTREATEAAKLLLERVIQGHPLKGDQERIGLSSVKLHFVKVTEES